MKTNTYFLIPLGFVLLSLICLALIIWGLSYALQRTPYSLTRQRRILTATTGILLVWVVFISFLSISGIVRNFSLFPLNMLLVILPPLVTALLLTFSKPLGELLKHVPPQRMIGLQSFRVVVEILLWALFIEQMLPVQMTFEGRNFDIIAGLTAPVAAYWVATKPQWRRIVLLIWNVGCLVLLFNIVGVSILSMPTPFRSFMDEPSSIIMTHFPFVWLPGVLVPIAYTMHFFSLRQLILKSDNQFSQTPPLPA